MPKVSKRLAALVGTVAAGILLVFVPRHEGEVLTTYYDPVNVATVCYGDTDPAMAVPGASYSREECLRSLERQLVAHAEFVLECAPGVAASPEMTAAFVSLAYNIGGSAFCGSTVARLYSDAAWLKDMALVTHEQLGPVLVLKLTPRGLDAATGRAIIPGVKRPGPRG